MAFGHASLVHILLSLVLLSSGYFAKFFSDGKMNLRGECMLLFGVLSAFLFMLSAKKAAPRRTWLLTLAGSLGLLLHLLFRGAPGWPNVAGWYGHMPPISLLGFLLAVAATILLLMNRRDPADGPGKPQ